MVGSEAKVNKNWSTAAVEEDVRWLYIIVNDAFIFEIAQSRRHTVEDNICIIVCPSKQVGFVSHRAQVGERKILHVNGKESRI
jgi:hypothetical protein